MMIMMIIYFSVHRYGHDPAIKCSFVIGSFLRSAKFRHIPLPEFIGLNILMVCSAKITTVRWGSLCSRKPGERGAKILKKYGPNTQSSLDTVLILCINV